jgi:hypothetical protein
MTRNTLNAICLGLLSILAIACGDAGGAPVEGDGDLGGVLAGEEGGNDGDANVGEDENAVDGNIEDGENDEDGNVEEGEDDDELDGEGENADDEEEEPEVFETEGQISVDVDVILNGRSHVLVIEGVLDEGAPLSLDLLRPPRDHRADLIDHLLILRTARE